jgi:hypothetical protein
VPSGHPLAYLSDLLGLRPLGALAGGELDPLVLLQTAETVNLDGGVVNEDVGGAVVWGDKPITLVSVEPLHGALSHVLSPTGTIFGIHGCVPRVVCDSLPFEGRTLGDPRRRLSKFRRRCDTFTNFDDNQNH